MKNPPLVIEGTGDVFIEDDGCAKYIEISSDTNWSQLPFARIHNWSEDRDHRFMQFLDDAIAKKSRIRVTIEVVDEDHP